MERLALHGGTPVRDGTKRWPKWPQFDEHELRNVREVFESGTWGGTAHGPMKMAAQEKFAAYHDARFGIGLISCTAGLEIGLKAFGVGAGDEVIVPAFTFIATAFAPMYLGATAVMADIHPGSLLPRSRPHRGGDHAAHPRHQPGALRRLSGGYGAF